MRRRSGGSTHHIRTLVFPSLKLIDEISYLPIGRTGATLFFQVMSPRDEHAATILTSNKGFEEWGEIFGDEVMAAALIDRLVHHCHTVNIRGNSHRIRKNTDVYRLLHPERDRPAPDPRRPRTARAEVAPT